MSNSDLPSQPSAGFSVVVPDCVVETCYERRGVIMPKFTSPRCLDQIENMMTRPDDLFIVTYPKSGTVWAFTLAWLIRFGGNISKVNDTSQTGMPTPFLESNVDFSMSETAQTNVEFAGTLPSPRMMHTHNHLEWLPEAIRTDDPKRKVIYVVRNPKDTAVSLYHFCLLWKALPSYESWDEFFEEFIGGRVPFGSWFDNVLPWWRRRNHPNVLFLKYEDLKKDLPGAILKMSEFMGKTVSDDAVRRIEKASAFGAMKESKLLNPDTRMKDYIEGGSFMRKGQVGDWKNYFTQAQSERFDQLYRQKMAGSGLELEFEL